MRNFAGTVARALRRAVSGQVQRYRRKAIEAELSHCFQRLEPRRVLTVNGAFDAVAGILTVDISQTGNTIATLRQQDGDSDRFFLDENNDAAFNPLNEVGGLKADLREIFVNGLGGTSVGIFQWLDTNAANSPIQYNLHTIVAKNVESVVFQTRAIVAEDSSLSASNAVEFGSIASGNEITFQKSLVVEVTGVASEIVTTNDARLTVEGLAIFKANSIQLGDKTGDTVDFGTVHFESTGFVVIHENSSMQIVNVGLNANRAESVSLHSEGTMELVSGSSIIADGDVSLHASTGDLKIDGTLRSETGDIVLKTDSAAGDVFILAGVTTESGSITMLSGDDIFVRANSFAGGIGHIELRAQNGTTDGVGLDGVIMVSGTQVATSGGDIEIVAHGEGDIYLSLVNAGSGDVLLAAEGSILDNNAWSLVRGNAAVGQNRISVDNPLGFSVGDVVSVFDDNSGSEVFSIVSIAGNALTLNGNLSSRIEASRNATVTAINVRATHLRMDADANGDGVGRIGNSDTTQSVANRNRNAIDTQVDFLAATAAQGIYVREVDGLTLASTSGNALSTTNGSIKVQSVNQDLVVDDAIHASGSGDILLQTLSSGNIVLAANVVSESGNISVLTIDGIFQTSSVQTSGGTVDFNALFNVTMDSPGAIHTFGGNVRINSGSIQIGLIDAQDGSVSMTVRSSITDRGVSMLNVVAHELRMVAETGRIGNLDRFIPDPDLSRAPIGTQVTSLAAFGNLGIFIRDFDGVTIGNTSAITVSRVNFNSTSSSVTDGPLEDLSSGNNGPILVQSVSGDIVLKAGTNGNPGISAHGSGDVLLQTLNSGSITISGGIVSGSGNVSVRSAGDIYQLADIATTGGTLDMAAANNISMSSLSQSITGGGDARLVAGSGTIQLGLVDVGSGDVSLTAGTSILDANGSALNVVGDSLRMVATNGVIGGSDLGNTDPDSNRNAIDTQVNVLAARSALGIYVQESDGLAIGNTDSVTVNRVFINGIFLPVTDATLEDLTTTSNGPIKLQSLTGGIVVTAGVNGNPGISANGSGDVLLQTLTTGSIDLTGSIISGTGSISIRSIGDIDQSATITTTGGSVEVSAAGDLSMGALSQILTGGGNARLFASSGTIRLGLVDAGSGHASVTAGTSILDANAGSLNVTASSLRMIATNGRIGNSEAGNGVPDTNVNAIDTRVGMLAARSALGIYVREADGVSIGSTSPMAVTRVNFNSTTTTVVDPTLEDLTTTSDGPIKLQSVAGSIVVTPGSNGNPAISAHGAGEILLQTLTTGGITLSGSITSGSGDVAIRAVGGVVQTANITTTGGTVFVSSGSNLTMGDGAQITTDGGNARLEATAGSIEVGLVNTGSGNASLIAGASILDANAGSLNVIANGLRMIATNGRIGDADAGNGTPDTNGNAIDTRVTTLAARSAFGIYVRELDGVTIGNTSPITVTRVNFNSTSTSIGDTSLEDLTTTTSNGPIKLQSDGGSIVINAGVNGNPGISANGSGDILLQTLNSGDITISGSIIGASGDIAIRSIANITQTANVISSGGSVFLSAGNNVTMGSAAQTTTAGGDARLEAVTGTIQLGLVNAGTGGASLIAGTSILDANAVSLNVIASDLQMVATSGRIGNADAGSGLPDANANAIDTQVTTLAARSALGIYVREADGVTVGNSSPIVVSRVNFNSTSTSIGDASLEDLTTTSNGPIKLQSLAGDIVVTSGTIGHPGISAHGTGDVLVQTLTSGNINLHGSIISSTGNISIRSADSMAQSSEIRTSGGSLDVAAANDVTMGLLSQIVTGGGHARIYSGSGSIQLGLVNAGTGDVSLTAGASILDANGGSLNVIASDLQMVAVNGRIGSSDIGNGASDSNISAIDTQVNSLAAFGNLGISIRELDGVTIGNTSATTVSRVNFNSTSSSVTDGPLEDLSSGNNGPILVQSVSGDIVLKAGTNGNPGISAHGSGDVLLQTLNSGSITISGGIVSGSGNVSVRSAGDIYQLADIATTGGTLDMAAANNISMSSLSQSITGGGDARFSADLGAIQLGLVNAGTGDVSLTAGTSILDANGTALNVVGQSLRMLAASGRIGDSDLGNTNVDSNRNAIDTQVTVLSARSALGIYIRESDGLTIGNTAPVTVNRVYINGTLLPVTDATLEDLTTTSNGPIKLQSLTGDIVVTAGVNGNPGMSANGSGDVLLQTLTTGSIDLTGSIISGTGSISIRSIGDIDQSATITTTGGSVDMSAAGDLSMGSLSQIITGGGNARLSAVSGTIQLGLVDAGVGHVSVTAGNSILDANAGSLNVIASSLQMIATEGLIGGADAGNGAPDTNGSAIVTRVATLAARSSQGIYVRESDGVTIGNTSAVTVDWVHFNSTTTTLTDSSLEDLTTTSDGPIKLQSITGDIVVTAGSNGNPAISANGSGDVLLQTLMTGTVDIQGTVQSETGNISIKSATDLTLTDHVRTAASGSLFFSAGRDVIWGVGVATIHTHGVDLMIDAGRDILLREINAGSGSNDVVLSAGRDIVDANDSVVVNTRNIWSRTLLMVADSDSDGIGRIGGPDASNSEPDANANAIDTQVTFLAAGSATGMYVRELDGLTIDSGSIEAHEVNFNSTRTDRTMTREALVTTHHGPIKVQTIAGDIVVRSGTSDGPGISVDGSGSILLQTLLGGDISVQGDLVTGSGNVSLRSHDDVILNAVVTTNGAGAIAVIARNSSQDGTGSDGVIMTSGSRLETQDGNVLVVASNEGDIFLGLIDATNGNVALRAERSILDNNDFAAQTLNVVANELSMVADSNSNKTGFIGALDQSRFGSDAATTSIDTNVNLLAARGTQGIFVHEVAGVIVGDAVAVEVAMVNMNSTEVVVSTAGVSGLTASGPIKVLVDTGSLQIDRTIVAMDDANRFDVSLKAFQGSIDEGNSAAQVKGDYLTLFAGLHAHLHATSVNTMRAEVYVNGVLDSAWQVVNQNANDRGDDFVAQLQRISASDSDSLRLQHQFQSRFTGYALYIVNDQALTIADAIAGSNSQSLPGVSPNIYVETLGNSNLNVSGIVQTNSNNSTEGAIVLIAGSKLSIAPTGRLETTTNEGAGYEQIINTVDLNARFFNAKEVPPGVAGFYTTRIVTLNENGSLVTPTPSTKTPVTHIFQQVAIQFGSRGERGFESFIGYADGALQGFEVAGQEFAQPFHPNSKSIDARPQGTDTTGLFIRQTPFTDQFLRANSDMPTDAVVRRSADFFLFENARDPSAIVDLTVASQPILDVISAGPQQGLPMPSRPVVTIPPLPAIPVAVEIIFVPIVVIQTQIELTTITEKQAQVFLYRVDYEDADDNGEPDQNELPDSEKILSELDDKRRIPFPGLKIPGDTKPNSAQPTQLEIERIKEALANDPETEVGVYSIIKQTANGEREVLDVIPIRDSDEPSEEAEESVRKLEPDSAITPGENPPAKPEDGAWFVPSDWKRSSAITSRSEVNQTLAIRDELSEPIPSLGLLLGSVWLRQNERTSDSTHGFSHRERLSRRLRRAMIDTSNNTNEYGNEP